MANNKTKDISFDIIANIGILSKSSSGWTKEINLVSWNGEEPKYDIRLWNSKHDKMSRGITLSQEEIEALKKILR